MDKQNSIWDELAHGLAGDNPAEYIKNLHDTGELNEVLPEVDALFGIPQTPEYHPEVDTGIHTLMALTKAAELKGDLAVRFATLVHDLGKALTDPEQWPKHHGHEELGVSPVEDVTSRLGTPKDVSDLAVNVARYHLHAHRALEMRPAKLVSLFENTDAFDNPAMFEQFIIAAQADAQGRLGLEDQPYPQADLLRSALHAASEVETQDLMDKGFSDLQLNEKIKERRIYAVSDIKQNIEINALD